MAVEALHRISLEEYRRLINAGVFDEDARIELIDGLAGRHEPQDARPRKRRRVAERDTWSSTSTRSATRSGSAAPLTIGNLRARTRPRRDPATPLPGRTTRQPPHSSSKSIVSSVTRDLTDKPPIYAQAGGSQLLGGRPRGSTRRHSQRAASTAATPRWTSSPRTVSWWPRRSGFTCSSPGAVRRRGALAGRAPAPAADSRAPTRATLPVAPAADASRSHATGPAEGADRAARAGSVGS